MSEADAAPKLRELRVYSAEQRERVSAAISAMLLQWRGAWDWRGEHTEDESLQVAVRDPADLLGGSWNPKWMACGPVPFGTSLLRMRWTAGNVDLVTPEIPVEQFAAYLWGAVDDRHLPEPTPAPESMAAEMARSMWQDFLRRWVLAAMPQGSAADSSPEIEERIVDWLCPGEFSGALLAQFSVASLQWTVALEAANVEALLAKNGNGKPAIAQKPLSQAIPVSLEKALRQRMVTFDAYLRPCTISLGALQNLRVGDVIALEHPLDQPSEVFSANRERVAHAWMTQTSGFKSLELAASTK